MTSTSPLLLNLRPEELAALDELAAHQEMSPEQVMRQALRLYQMDWHKRQAGYHSVYVDDQGQPEPDRFPLLAPIS